jgi:hypothetical protein
MKNVLASMYKGELSYPGFPSVTSMFNAQSLFSAALIAATTVTTVWGKAQAVLYFTDNCISSHSSTIGMSTGVCHSEFPIEMHK